MIDGLMMPHLFGYAHYLALNNFPPNPFATALTAELHLLNNCPQSATEYLRMLLRKRAGILEVLTPIIPVFKAAMDG